MKKPTAVDLFSGCGGLTLGLKQAGFKVVGAVEIDALAASAYEANHPDVSLLRMDIRSVTGPQILSAGKVRPGSLDLLAGCPPCQGFSSMRRLNGRRRIRDDQNDLIFEFLRLVRSLRPRAVMLENVPWLLRTKRFATFQAGLRRLGYEVAVDVKDAQHYGVPQRRRRVILLAIAGKRPRFAKAASRTVSVRQAIGHLPPPGRSGDFHHDRPQKRSERVQALFRRIPKNGGSRSALPRREQLACHKHCDGFKDVYGRMTWGKVAPTITGGCFNPSKGRFLHPSQDRAISLREAALLQGFPRRYAFPQSSSKQALAVLIGNALPPEFIRRHALQLKHTLKAAAQPRSGR